MTMMSKVRKMMSLKKAPKKSQHKRGGETMKRKTRRSRSRRGGGDMMGMSRR